MDVGIDLGSTFSVIAVKGQVTLVDGYPQAIYLPECDVSVIPSPDGGVNFPSVLWVDQHDPSRILIGAEAKQKVEEGDPPIMFSKRSIGTDEPLKIHDRSFTAKEVATYILKYLKECAELALGQSVRRAVVTHPAYFVPNQLQQTREAAIEAGFDMTLPEQMMMEPAAAALAYTMGVEKDPLKVITYDLGGGAFDVAVLERNQGVITIKAFDGDHLLGGYNFDRALVEWILERLQEKGRVIPYNENDPEDRGRRGRLLQLAESVKIRLFEQRNGKVFVDIEAPDILVDVNGKKVQILERINREQYAELIKEHLEKTIRCCRSALHKAGLTPEEIDGLLLIGGSTYGQWVSEAVEKAFGKHVDLHNPDLCVAAGAAIRTAELMPSTNGEFDQVYPRARVPYSERKNPSGIEDVLLQDRSSDYLLDGVLLSDAAKETSLTLFQSDADVLRYEGSLSFLKRIFDHTEPPKRLGSYEILGELGRGHFTIVYLAKDTTSLMEKLVALKVPFRQGGDEYWMERLKKEAKIWKDLSASGHPNILTFEDLKRHEGYTYFVTEYVDGGNWDTILKQVPENRRIAAVISTLSELCRGLIHAHERQVVHGDLKPQNVLVSSDLKCVKLGDFGLSFLAHEATSDPSNPSRPVGTQMFMAPESFDGQQTPQTDIYALGVTLVYLLTGEYPFKARSETIEKLKTERLQYRPDVRAKNPKIPEWLEAVVRRCLAAQPEYRFPHATELLEHVMPFIDPSKGQRIILMAWCNPENNTVDFDLEIKGQRTRSMLTVEVPGGTIKGLCKQWETLGELAIERVERQSRGLPHCDVDSKIRERLHQVSEDGAHLMLGAKVRGILQGQSSGLLWLLHDPRLAGIPWELFRINESPLCRRYGLARSPRLLRQLSHLQSTIESEEKIRVVIVSDTCGDLPGAKEECERLQQEFASCSIADKLVVDLVDDSHNLFDLQSRMLRCHILHYAGHAVFSEKHGDLSRSGWFFKGDIQGYTEGDAQAIKSADLLHASALEDFWSGHTPPFLVFANACNSGRGSPETLNRKRVHSDAAMGLAQAFLSAGVGNYVGTAWESPDEQTTSEFAVAFYHEFFAGRTVSQALQMAREMCLEKYGEEDLTWARYVLFGDPFTHIPARWRAKPAYE